MLNKLNQQLAALKEQERVRTKLRSQLEQVQTDLLSEHTKIADLKQSLAKETDDVEKLSGVGLTAIFYMILGNKEKQLQKEIQEQLAAQLKYDESAATLVDLEAEEKELQQKLTAFDKLDQEFKTALTEKEAALLSKENEISLQLNKMADEVIDLQSKINEVEEAIAAGSEVLAAVEKVVDDLNSAKNWGTWDMFGGGMMVTAIKHGKIDDAKAAMHQVQQRLRKFNYELNDINQNEGLSINIDSFEKFSDFFFDNLIFDWVVQSKIESSLQSSLTLGNRVVEVLNRIQNEKVKLQKQLEDLKLSRGLLIQDAGANPGLSKTH